MKPQPKIKLSTLHLNDGSHGLPKNPRFIRDARFKKLCDSIRDFPDAMKARGVVIDERGVILGGNMRWRACRELGMKEIPAAWVHRLTGLTVEQKRRFIIMDNRGFGEDDMDLLANEWDIDELIGAGFDEEELTGLIDKDDDTDAEPQMDKAEELNKVWKVKTGDLWQIGEHRLACGDCADKAVVERVMGGERATCVFADPPYGVDIGAKNRMLNSFQPSGRNLTDIVSDGASEQDLRKTLLAAFTLCRETAMADDCAIFVCSPQGGSLGLMMMMMMDSGLPIRHVLNWVKNCPTFSMGRLDYEYQHEPILFTWKKTHKRIKAGPFQTSVWTVDKPRASPDHPTIKPVELPSNAIQNHTDTGDIVYDPFLGSGTTMVACQNLNRKCRGIEISPAYCAVILQRMTDAFPGIKIEKVM